MNRRGWLTALVFFEALLYVALEGARSVAGGARLDFSQDTTFPTVLIPIVAFFTPLILPAVIGSLCAQWQAAIALNILAVVPGALIFALSITLSSSALAVNVASAPLSTLIVVGLMGSLGWLFRFIRREFATGGR